MYLYLLRNTVNGKGYVGITTQPLKVRLRDHLSKARNGRKTLIGAAIRKYGAEAFVMTQIGEACSWEVLADMERRAIAGYGTFMPQDYNMTLGGDGTLGRLHSGEAKARISTAKQGKPLSGATRAAMSKANKGRPKSATHRAAISAAQLGEKNHQFGTHITEEHKQRLRETHTGNTYAVGYKASAEVRAFMSAIRTGRKHTPEAREKMAAAKRGKPRSAETRAKVSAGLRRYQTDHGNPMQGKTQSPATRALISARMQASSRSILYEEVIYANSQTMMAQTGLSRNQIQGRLRKGTAIYLDKE